MGLHSLQAEIDKIDTDEEGGDEGDGADEAGSDDGDAEDTADASSSATSPPSKIKGIWWLERGDCYQAKRKIGYEDDKPSYEWKRFKPDSEKVEHLIKAHDEARDWVRAGI